ncbi:MATE efflux family protein [Trifolium repens]|nr:MATE efflux family protein [Trifolium repens]
MTKASLEISGAGNFLNVILDPILIFLCGLGISSAAIATVIYEYVRNAGCEREVAEAAKQPTSDEALQESLLRLSWALVHSKRSEDVQRGIAMLDCKPQPLYLSLLLNMQVYRSGDYSRSRDLVESCLEALLASSYSLGNYEQAHLIIYRVIQIGLGAGITLSMILFFGFGPFSSLFSTDSEVLDVAQSGILFVAGSQPVNALAFVIDGFYYGVSDFEYAAYSMVLVGLISSIFMLVATPVVGLPGVWTGLFLFMMLHVLAGVWRISSKSGPWDMIWYKDEAED